ncbi:TcpQ domain-containing protein [Aquincola sp. S2]|uniref:TcpQ domain-containing protein n=1 Tax=Pseudaquabacterium terrae TaxID=2732868 RepID=A0ABX2EIH7_9BURK|nr:toxin co-regulated pilus biosynthesis Q family protein [Aquabacterium terrae]NRF68447.1 TcpQ domain-containing protein [Aquabacterium terrae]
MKSAFNVVVVLAACAFAAQVCHASDGAKPASTEPATTQWTIATSDATVKSAIARWAKTAGWQLVWELPVDYSIGANATLNGSFEEAVETVVRSMQGAETPMKAVFYRGNNVLRIVAKGMQ